MSKEADSTIVTSGRDRYGFLPTPKLVRQQALDIVDGVKFEKWTYETEAANGLVAPRIVKMHIRANYPRVDRMIKPMIEDISETEQSKLRDFFGNTIGQELYTVTLIVTM